MEATSRSGARPPAPATRATSLWRSLKRSNTCKVPVFRSRMVGGKRRRLGLPAGGLLVLQDVEDLAQGGEKIVCNFAAVKHVAVPVVTAVLGDICEEAVRCAVTPRGKRDLANRVVGDNVRGVDAAGCNAVRGEVEPQQHCLDVRGI